MKEENMMKYILGLGNESFEEAEAASVHDNKLIGFDSLEEAIDTAETTLHNTIYTIYDEYGIVKFKGIIND